MKGSSSQSDAEVNVKKTALASGFGRTHTDKYKPLVCLTFEDIEQTCDNPQEVNKEQARWVIPSSLMTRDWKKQEAHGKYWCLWADIDENPPSLNKIKKVVKLITLNARYEVFTTKSATVDNQKCRILVPLDKPLLAGQWQLAQECFNDALESKGITPDRTNQGLGQLCFLPNRGEYYDNRCNRSGGYLDPLCHFSKQIQLKRKAVKKNKKETKKKIAEAKDKREKRISEGFDSPIDAFNAAYLVEDILLRCGYKQNGNTFMHPNSDNGSYSASVKDGRVHSLSTSDPLFSKGKGAHDSFSAFCVLYHKGDENIAIKDAGDNWLSIKGESWNKAKQREYMQSKPASLKACNNVSPLETLLSLSANGESEKMEKQMSKDVHVLRGLAILGQWTVLYGAPNNGKTLITLWLLCEAIREGRINGHDVFYANCDDTFRGGVEKLALAEKAGFYMLIPGVNGFSAEILVDIMESMSEKNQAKGKIIILDTLKKFTDLMDKQLSSKFGNKARMFVSAGGTLICLAHVNKRKGENGKSIHAGTSDIPDDADCCFTIEKIG